MDNDALPIPHEWNLVLDYFMTTPRCTKRDAYAHVYGKKGSNSQQASALWKQPRFAAEYERRRNPVMKQNALKIEEILHHLHSLVTADVRDLIEIHRCSCRYCHGIGFRRQRKPSEFEEAIADYRKTEAGQADPMLLTFDHAGGVGYNPKRPPNPDCPECFGEGEMRTFAKDMRNLTKAQAELILGVKETDKGFEIKTRDKTKGLELMMRNLGMLTADKGDEDNSKIPPAGVVTWAVEDGDKDPKNVP